MKILKLLRARFAWSALAFVTVFSSFASTNVVVWDTMSRGEKVAPRQSWKVVPSNLMELEKDPLKSASDPGYYGRDYQFTGDVVVENSSISVSFQSASGIAAVSSKARMYHGEPVFIGEITPIRELKDNRAVEKPIQHFELIRNTADEVVVLADYGSEETAQFSFGRDEIIDVKPSKKMKGVAFWSVIDYGIAPAFVGDDLIYSADPEAAAKALLVPADNIFVGLLSGEGKEIVMTWPKGNQKLRLLPGAEKGEFLPWSAIEIETSGESVFFAPLAAKGIWHKQKLNSDFLETDVTLSWKPPFMAKWQTQLTEGSVKTTYAFRHAKGTVWRGVPGSYNYPVWFDGDKANFSLSKKVPPRGDAVIYFLEGNDTPADVLTPVDVLKATLGRPMAESIVDVEGRKLRTHHGAAGSNVHRACTCGYTEAIQGVFEKGQECDQKQFVDESIQDMIYFVRRHLQRINEYRAFATSLTEYLHATAKSNPELKEYLDDLEQTVQQIPAEYENQKENMKGLNYAAELEKKTMALTGKKDPENLKKYMELLKMWRGMGGAQDYVVAQYHMITRRLFQDAGYNVASISNPKAVEVAQEIRARIKQVLRNPDGYEIWANY